MGTPLRHGVVRWTSPLAGRGGHSHCHLHGRLSQLGAPLPPDRLPWHVHRRYCLLLHGHLPQGQHCDARAHLLRRCRVRMRLLRRVGGPRCRVQDNRHHTRVIFWAHYLDWVVTGPLILADLALLSRSDTPTIISLVGNMVLYVICGLIGALTVAPYKYMWWVASLIFLIIVFMLLLQRLNNAEGYSGDALKGLTWLTILVWLVYPIVWIVGSEGTGALGLSQEAGIITIADLIAKIGFGFYLLANVDAPEAESAPLNQSSQQYV